VTCGAPSPAVIGHFGSFLIGHGPKLSRADESTSLFAYVHLDAVRLGVRVAATALDGASMTWPWGLPFIGILASIATCPLLFPKVWHDHYGKIAFGWAALALACLAIFNGILVALAAFVHSIFREYLSFILLLFALYTVAGGILVTGRIQARPWTNAGMALGTSIASMIGTTGAVMILVRPVIRANEFRTRKTHVVIFFIILVANVGGALTPLGDPPLFIGFLHGVDFFWTTQNLWLQTLIVAVLILAIFLALDTWHFRKESVARSASVRLGMRGKVNFFLISIIIGAMLASAAWKPGIAFDVYGSSFELQNLIRDAAFIVVALVSLWLTPDEHRAANGFSWEPIREVAILSRMARRLPPLSQLVGGRCSTCCALGVGGCARLKRNA
jgi:Na+/H+ antiporter NhaD/arsenite permease-like protein